MQKMHMHDVESSPSGGEHSWIIQEYFPPRKSVVIQVEREADVRKPLFLMLMILIRSCCHMVSSNFALPRFPWAHLPPAPEDEAGQKPLCGRVRHRPGTPDPRFSRRRCCCAGGRAEDRHVLAEAARIRLLSPQLRLLVFRQHGEEYGVHAAGPGGDQDIRYGGGEGHVAPCDQIL